VHHDYPKVRHLLSKSFLGGERCLTRLWF